MLYADRLVTEVVDEYFQFICGIDASVCFLCIIWLKLSSTGIYFQIETIFLSWNLCIVIFRVKTVCSDFLIILGIPYEQRVALQDQLTRLILRVIIKYPHLRYYQVNSYVKKKCLCMNVELKAIFWKWKHYRISTRCNVHSRQKWNISSYLCEKI